METLSATSLYQSRSAPCQCVHTGQRKPATYLHAPALTICALCSNFGNWLFPGSANSCLQWRHYRFELLAPRPREPSCAREYLLR
jgi:hypothetical protein